MKPADRQAKDHLVYRTKTGAAVQWPAWYRLAPAPLQPPAPAVLAPNGLLTQQSQHAYVPEDWLKPSAPALGCVHGNNRRLHKPHDHHRGAFFVQFAAISMLPARYSAQVPTHTVLNNW